MIVNQRLIFAVFFFTYCVLILVNPFPLGSNRAWAWSIEAMVATLLFSLMLLISIRFKSLFNFESLNRIKLELILLATWLLVNVLYITPMPIALLSLLAPNVASAYAELGLSYGYLSLDVYASFETLMLSIYYLVFFVTGILLINSRKKVIVVLSLLFFLAVFESIYGMYLVSIGQTGLFVQVITVSKLHASGTYINKNHLVAFLAMCFFAGLCLRVILNRKLYIETNNFISKFIRFLSSPVRLIDVCLLIIIAAIWNTHSRAGLVSFIIALLFFIGLKLFLLKGRKINLKTISVILVSVLLFLIVIAEDVTHLLNSMGQNSEDSVEFITKTAQGRLMANQQILEHYPSYWFSGVGPGAYETFFVNHRSIEQVSFFDHAHNDYLEFLIEYGVFSLVLLGLLIVIIYRIVKTSFNSKSHLTRLLGFAAITSIIYMLMHGTMDFNARIPANVVTLIVVISLVYARLLMKKAN